MIPGITITAQIYESANCLIYRGFREQDFEAVILKVLKSDYPEPSELIQYQREYEILRNLNIEGVIKVYSLENYERSLVLVFEDFGGDSLTQLIDEKSRVSGMVMPLEKILKIAIQLTEILNRIHSHNIIHKDINPSNIVFNPKTDQVKIIDFGISSLVGSENSILNESNALEGTLAYISPEQTGRMARPLDYRTDFYSLGVTFYELLTGQLPFQTKDVLELVHCQIAKQPVPPHQVNPEISEAVSDIVMKLMAKTVEDRYQSAWGIKVDLVLCLMQLEANGVIADIVAGESDVSEQFKIPKKLYGREREAKEFLAVFERIRAADESINKQNIKLASNQADDLLVSPSIGHFAKEIMLIAGCSGVGKSSLMEEIYQPIAKKQGYFLSIKFEQTQPNIVYSAVIQAFAELIQQLLTESEENLWQWREKLLGVLGTNCQAIIDLIPEVELIIGEQTTRQYLSATELKDSLPLIFQKLIPLFSSRQHPLVIFIDNLQWAEASNLKLIEDIIKNKETQYIILIGAYRDDEVNYEHQLVLAINQWCKEGILINKITLNPLGLDCINQLIADTLHTNIEHIKSLAKIVEKKTKGSPFLIIQFLTKLYRERLIYFDEQRISWRWEIKSIDAVNINDNSVKLMIVTLTNLPKLTQQILHFAASLGNHFDLYTLSIICKFSAKKIYQHLVPALQAELILPISLDAQLLTQDYKFVNDQIQQAAYTLVEVGQLQTVNFKTRDCQYIVDTLVFHSLNSYLIGNDLTKLEHQMINSSRIIDHLNQNLSLSLHNLYLQIVANLLGLTENPYQLIGEAYNEEIMLPIHQEAKECLVIGHLYINKVALCYLFEEYNQAIKNITLVDSYLNNIKEIEVLAFFTFYNSLVQLAVYGKTSQEERQLILLKVEANQQKMKKWQIRLPQIIYIISFG